ncbi:phosphatidylinositol-specific phospholipase C, partial [filamentous cyanobacterium LEGE 11480]
MSSSTAAAHRHPAYSHNARSVASNPNWMSRISGNKKLSQLSLPGTHDTMSRYGGDIPKTQSMTLPQQLQSGIRVLDIRNRHIKNAFAIHHGPVFQKAMFGDVLNQARAFLRRNPSETILMRVKPEHTATGNTRSFEATFKNYKTRYPGLFYTGSSDDPRLKAVRGKIVVLQNFSGGDHGLPYSRMFKASQDDYKLTTNWSLYSKWTKIKSLQRRANASNGNQGFYINYLSGAVGAFPYFVASGHSSPGTSAPRLSTGLTTIVANRSKYRDFPRTTCLGKACTISFEGTNVLFANSIKTNSGRYYEPSRQTRYTGIVMADFPGKELIN